MLKHNFQNHIIKNLRLAKLKKKFLFQNHIIKNFGLAKFKKDPCLLMREHCAKSKLNISLKNCKLLTFTF